MDLYSAKIHFIRIDIEIYCVFTLHKNFSALFSKNLEIFILSKYYSNFVLNNYKQIGALSRFLQLRTIEITSTQLNWFMCDKMHT